MRRNEDRDGRVRNRNGEPVRVRTLRQSRLGGWVGRGEIPDCGDDG